MLLFLETDLQVIEKGLACFFCAVKPWDQKKCPLKRGVHLWEVKNEKISLGFILWHAQRNINTGKR